MWEAESRRMVVWGKLGEWLKWQSTCLAIMRPWVQTPVPKDPWLEICTEISDWIVNVYYLLNWCL
jgi:hypothetical protein